MLDELLFNTWVDKEKRSSRNHKRKYPHFDPKINFKHNITFFHSYFLNPKNVATHAFYPFIRMVIKTPKYKKTDKKDEKGRNVREITLKERPISYSAHFDAFIYSWYSSLLTKKYEDKLEEWGIEDNVTAYLQKGKSNIEFAHEVFQFIKSKRDCVALAFDITSFFDGLEHEHLKNMWGLVIDSNRLPDDHFKVFQSLTNYTYIEKDDLEKEFPNIIPQKGNTQAIKRICEPDEFRKRIRAKMLIEKNQFKIKVGGSSRYGQICGIPQGAPISACLSNIYMIDFDKIINELIGKLGGLYRRYCDDIIVVVDKHEAESVKNLILETIKTYHLEINESKTEITYFSIDKNDNLRGFDRKDSYRNLQYLGFEFNGQNTYIRSSSMSRYYQRMSSRMRENLKAAYGNRSIGTTVFRKKLYNRYTEKGERNFLSYARRAKEKMGSSSIHKQYKNSLSKVSNRFEQKKQRFEQKREINNPKN